MMSSRGNDATKSIDPLKVPQVLLELQVYNINTADTLAHQCETQVWAGLKQPPNEEELGETG